MNHIALHLSPSQASKLRNGHKVRVKKGTGFNLIVHPNTYHIVNRAFAKGKGAEISLSPEELALNQFPSPEKQKEMIDTNPVGKGLFKSKRGGSVQSDFENAFDPYKNGIMTKRGGSVQSDFENAFDPYKNGIMTKRGGRIKKGKGMWDWADPNKNGVARAFQPAVQAAAPYVQQSVPILKLIAKEVAKEAIPLAVDYGKDYLKAGITTSAGPVAGAVINRQIDKASDQYTPMLSDYVVDKIGTGLRRRHYRGRGLSSGEFGNISKPSTESNLDYLKNLDTQNGSHYANLAHSTIENARANDMNEYFTRQGINQRREANNIMGNGVRVMPRDTNYLPQALMSQPLSANYHFRCFFPVNFQLMTREAEQNVIGGMGLGTGLYL